MRKTMLRVAALASLTAAGYCVGCWNARRALPYNEQGRFFNANSAVVLHEQAVTIYGSLALGLAVFALTFWMMSRK